MYLCWSDLKVKSVRILPIAIFDPEPMLRSLITIIFAIPYTILCALGAALSCVFPGQQVPTLVMRAWAKVLLAVAGVRLEIEGLARVDPAKPSIYMSNHESIMDILVLIAAIPVDLRFIFKQSILWFPFVGQAIYLMGMVPIDRSSRAKAKTSLAKAGKRIRKGAHILIFPEGTRSHGDGLLPFKKGGFHLSLSNGIDIVPISISNSANLCGRNSVWASSGVINVMIHPRLATTGYGIEDRHHFVDLVREQIVAGIGRVSVPEVATPLTDVSGPTQCVHEPIERPKTAEH